MKPKKTNREYRAMTTPLTVQETQNKRIDTDKYVEGYATTFNKPYVLCELNGVKYYEVIDHRAFDYADMSDVIMQYDHKGKVLARNKNGTLLLEADERGLFVCADLSKSRSAEELYEEIQNGLVTKMSMGFRVAKDFYNKETRTRTILKFEKIYDVSPVIRAANEDTDITAHSYFDGVIEVERREALVRRAKLLRLKIKLED